MIIDEVNANKDDLKKRTKKTYRNKVIFTLNL